MFFRTRTAVEVGSKGMFFNIGKTDTDSLIQYRQRVLIFKDIWVCPLYQTNILNSWNFSKASLKFNCSNEKEKLGPGRFIHKKIHRLRKRN